MRRRRGREGEQEKSLNDARSKRSITRKIFMNEFYSSFSFSFINVVCGERRRRDKCMVEEKRARYVWSIVFHSGINF